MAKLVDQHCPGDDPGKKSVPQMFTCPSCGGRVEIWSDEKTGSCMSCKKKISREDLRK